MKYRNHSVTNVGKVRTANEDNYGDAITPNGHLFVVCDGMGGHVGGAKASSIAVTSIIEYFQREQYSNLIQAIDRALSFANEQIYANALSDPELKGMGTTAVVLIISGIDCYIGHVGDSRIYLKSNNKLHRITKDHSFVQTLVDSGVISDEEAESHPNKNQILKALGTSSVIEGTISQNPIQVKAGDIFLLCSDGLNGMVNDRGLEMMLQGEDLNKSGDDLIRAALDAGGNDNITLTIVAIDESVYYQSKFEDFNPVKRFDGGATQTFMASVGGSNLRGGGLFSLKVLGLLGSILVVLAVAVYFLVFSGGSEELTSPKEVNKQGEQKETDLSLPNKQSSSDQKPKSLEANKTQSEKTHDPEKNKNNEDKKSEVKKNVQWPIQHVVIAGETLYAIVNKYKSENEELSHERIVKFNTDKKNNPKLSDKQRSDLAEERISQGMILMIPGNN